MSRSLDNGGKIKLNLIYPCIEATPAKQIYNNIQTKQNHVIRLMFFATLFSKNTDSALPLLGNLNGN